MPLEPRLDRPLLTVVPLPCVAAAALFTSVLEPRLNAPLNRPRLLLLLLIVVLPLPLLLLLLLKALFEFCLV